MGFALLAGVENLDFQNKPSAGADAPGLVSYYESVPGVAFVLPVGLLSLVCFAAFTVLVAMLAAGPSGPARTPAAVLAGGVIGTALAATALAAGGWMAADPTSAPVLHPVQGVLRAAAGPFVALIPLVASSPLRRRGLIPGWLAVLGRIAGIGLVCGGVAAVHPTATTDAAMFAAYAGAVGWIIAVSAAFLVAPIPGWQLRTATILCAAVAVAAAISGAALTALPATTVRYFSWPLGPAPLAALVGGAYLAAAAGFAVALGRRDDLRIALVGIIGLSVPICVATSLHLHAFDLGRWQSIAWIALFTGFPVAAAVALTRLPPGPPAHQWPGRTRSLLTGYALIAFTAAIRLWSGAIYPLPADVGPLGSRVLASWFVFAGVVALWQAWLARSVGRTAAVILGGLPAMWLVAAYRLPSDDDTARFVWTVTQAVLGLVAVSAWVSMRTARVTAPPAVATSPTNRSRQRAQRR